MSGYPSEPAELDDRSDELADDLALLAELLRANRPRPSASFRARVLEELAERAGPESSPFFNFGVPSW